MENTVRGCYGSHGEEGWSRPKQYLSREFGKKLGKGGLVLSKMCHCSGSPNECSSPLHAVVLPR